MSILDRLLGRDEEPPPARQPQTAERGVAPPMSADEQAVARYRYMLQTAPPEMIEQAHGEAFAKLTPEQRRMALQQMSAVVPENERAAADPDDPQSLARMATRAEVRQPGALERAFGGGMGGGMGMGGLIAGGLMTSIAGSFIGSAIAHQFFSDPTVINHFHETNPDVAGGGDAGETGGGDAADAGDQTDSLAINDVTAAGDDMSVADLGGDLGGDFGGDLGGDF